MASTKIAATEALETLEAQTEKKVERRGRKKGHAPSNPTGKGPMVDSEPMTDERRELISRLMKETLRTYSMPKVRDDDELAQRFVDYFNHCADSGERPTVEQLCQCTGWTISTVYGWETGRSKGFSSDTAKLVKKAKEFLAVFDAKMVSEGKLNPVVYIFRAKNYYGMKDQQDLTIAPANPLGGDPDQKRLASDYLTQLPDAKPPAIDVDYRE